MENKVAIEMNAADIQNSIVAIDSLFKAGVKEGIDGAFALVQLAQKYIAARDEHAAKFPPAEAPKDGEILPPGNA